MNERLGGEVVDGAEQIRGLWISARSLEETTRLLIEWVHRRDRTRYFACVNVHSAELVHRDPEFMSAVAQADIRVADGIGLVMASWMSRGTVRSRVTGPDLFFSTSRALSDLGGRSVFYLGGSDRTLERIRQKHLECFPNLRIAGTYSPPFATRFHDEELAAMADRVNQASPDVLWIGLGAPKQEKWALANRDRLRVPVCGPIGAMFDYFAGNVPMPPKWVDRAGLQWAHRLATNPARVWRRSFDIPLFIGHVVRERLRRACIKEGNGSQ
jgi:N-acetylglucosaminyldiphosphoundecaprenol N-acetyl-beta-D-mannosaminyltransferase